MAKLSYEDFIEKAQRNDEADTWGLHLMRAKRLLDDSKQAFVAIWVSGGVTGGNCWDTGGHYSLEAEKEPDLDQLMDLLEEADVTLREGRKILELVRTGSFGESGYYGNYTDYGYKYVTFDEVYDKLVEFGKAEPRTDSPTP